ncbi:MAG: hypothetical protein OIF38_05130, partial [Cellvibrionaceae bacterium]|nr:hypothetical protein [Cellvibrionaceae bacterium]
TKGETAEAFTAVIGVRAHLDRAGSSAQARQDQLLLMIVAGEQLSLSHFVRDYPDGRHNVAIAELPGLLRQEFGKKSIECYDKKGAYLARLYGALRGKKDAVSQQEAKNAARTFARFMAYKPVESVDQFVAAEVLEAKDLGDTIRRIRDLLRTVHGMEQEASALAQSVELLAGAKTEAGHYLEDWLEHSCLNYGAAAAQYQANQRQYLAAKDEQQILQQRCESITEQQAQQDQRIIQARDKLIKLEAKIQGVPALRSKQSLEQQQQQLNDELSRGLAPLSRQDQQRDTNLDALRNIQQLLKRHSLALALPQLGSKAWQQASKALSALQGKKLPDISQLLGRDWIDLAPLESGREQVQEEEQWHNSIAELLFDKKTGNAGELQHSLSQEVDLLCSERERELQQLLQQQQSLERYIKNLEAKQINYPRHVQEAISAIKQQCPAADPRVLCEHIEIIDEHWQMAIEGYMGDARYGILVEADCEAQAAQIVRALKFKGRKSARVIQGHKASQDAQKLSLSEDSIVHSMRFSHRTAEHYLKASYGSVLKVADAQQLRKTRRGLCAEGLGSGNYAMFRCDLGDDQLLFGEAARERNLRAQRDKLQLSQTQLQQANDSYQAVHQLALQLQRFAPLNWSQCFSELLQIQRQLEVIDNDLANLDLSDHRQLEQQKQEAEAEHEQLSQQRQKLAEEIGGVNEKLNSCQANIKKLADRADQLLQQQDDAEIYLLNSDKYWPGLDLSPRLEAMEARLAQNPDAIDFSDQQKNLSEQLSRTCIALQQRIELYNQQAQPADQLLSDSAEPLHSAGFFGHIFNLQQQLDQLYNRLHNNVLLEKQEQLSGLRDTFNTTFVSDLCNEIHQAIRDGERTLKNINRELEHHCFGADRERFTFEWEWLPEFKEYWDFFKEIIAIPNLGDGSSLFDSEISPKAMAIRDKLLALLLDGDEQQALRELARISDYRHYRRYDILKHPHNKAPIRLSQYGTGSGGQLETPAYIIRAAAITSAFRFNEGNSHLRMVIVDEAFMHMDETRSREVIAYLTDTLGLQLTFIMPTSKAGPFLDLISNQFVFAKVPSPQPLGELNTRVLVDRQQLNQDRIKELWAQHRRVIRQQGSLDFMEGL